MTLPIWSSDIRSSYCFRSVAGNFMFKRQYSCSADFTATWASSLLAIAMWLEGNQLVRTWEVMIFFDNFINSDWILAILSSDSLWRWWWIWEDDKLFMSWSTYHNSLYDNRSSYGISYFTAIDKIWIASPSASHISQNPHFKMYMWNVHPPRPFHISNYTRVYSGV